MVSLPPSFSLKRSNSIVIEEVALEERALPPVTWSTAVGEGWAMFTLILSWVACSFPSLFPIFPINFFAPSTWIFDDFRRCSWIFMDVPPKSLETLVFPSFFPAFPMASMALPRGPTLPGPGHSASQGGSQEAGATRGDATATGEADAASGHGLSTAGGNEYHEATS